MHNASTLLCLCNGLCNCFFFIPEMKIFEGTSVVYICPCVLLSVSEKMSKNRLWVYVCIYVFQHAKGYPVTPLIAPKPVKLYMIWCVCVFEELV